MTFETIDSVVEKILESDEFERFSPYWQARMKAETEKAEERALRRRKRNEALGLFYNALLFVVGFIVCAACVGVCVYAGLVLWTT